MIKLIIFDLDGVLIDTEDIHYTSLLDAIHFITGISHDNLKNTIKQDGSSTKDKLKIIQDTFGVTTSLISRIDSMKQSTVLSRFSMIGPSHKHIDIMYKLRELSIKISLASNSRRQNINLILERMGLLNCFDSIHSSDDVDRAKPDPEIFLTSMYTNNCMPRNTLILEDSVTGVAAAKLSNANIFVINSINDVTIENIKYELQKYKTKYSDTDGRNGLEIF